VSAPEAANEDYSPKPATLVHEWPSRLPQSVREVVQGWLDQGCYCRAGLAQLTRRAIGHCHARLHDAKDEWGSCRPDALAGCRPTCRCVTAKTGKFAGLSARCPWFVLDPCALA
jgi:hypothetical protein